MKHHHAIIKDQHIYIISSFKKIESILIFNILKINNSVFPIITKKYMKKRTLSFPYGLIGSEMELQKDVIINIDEEGKINSITGDSDVKALDLMEKKENLLVIPGLINAHAHVGDSFAKEVGFNQELKQVVAPPNGLKHHLLRNIPEEIKSNGIKKAIAEMFCNGITCFADFREEGRAGILMIKHILNEESIKCMILGRFENTDEMGSVFELADGLGLASYNKIKKEFVAILKSLKRKYGKIIACHCAEVERKEELIERVFNEDLIDIIVHGTHFNERDLLRIKEKQLFLVLCPRSNGYFGVGFPPINEILKLNIPVSIGTDNVMTNNLNLFEELRYLYRIQRVLNHGNERVVMGGLDMLKMITINAAQALRMQHEIGSISEGKDGDFNLLDLNHPNYFTSDLNKSNIHAIIVQRTNPENIRKVYIKGKIVYEKC